VHGFADAIFGFETAILNGEFSGESSDRHLTKAKHGGAFLTEKAVDRNVELISIPEIGGGRKIIEFAEGHKDLAEFCLGVVFFESA